MYFLLKGFLAGMMAGIVMGGLSHAGYLLGVFRSSLILIDGSFVAARLGLKPEKAMVLGAGTVMHLVTSGVFGALYILIVTFLNWNLFSGFLVAVYFLILYISMLFTALPVAGQGMLGAKAGPFTWLEQLILHVVFGVAFFVMLTVVW